jgi:clan AA aspartic protease (TIGR02281 family)
MLFDQLSFETLDMTDYKYVKMEFSIHCQSGCSSSIKEYLKWYYTVLENLKVEGNGIEGFEVFASDSIWMEKMDKPGLLTMQNLLNSMKVYETALDGRIYNIPFTTNVGSFTKDIPYSPIDCTVEEYFKRAKVKKKYNIPIKQRNGSYLIKVNIGGKIMEYIIDSGASLITITPSMEKYLIESKIIDTTSYLKPQRFELADGSIKEYKTVLIPWIGVNGIFVNNIIAAVSDNETTPLLGKSFFDNFSYWKIDNYSNNIELLKK